MNKINWVFFGTDEFAVGALEELARQGFVPNLIVTTPNTPQGRKLTLMPPAVKLWADNHIIKTIQPESLKTIPVELTAEPWDLFVVASYGKIIPGALLKIPRRGALNIHPSLLPLYRGSSPLQTSILNGDIETGVTVMLMDNKVDHGPIIAQEKIIVANPTYEELRDTLAAKGALLLAQSITPWLANEITATTQDHSQATLTRKVAKQDGFIDLNDDPIQNDRKIRAYSSWPGTYFFIKKNDKPMRIVIKKATMENGQLIIDRVIPEGKHEMDWADFSRNLA